VGAADGGGTPIEAIRPSDDTRHRLPLRWDQETGAASGFLCGSGEGSFYENGLS
jgi:hypothetical protein